MFRHGARGPWTSLDKNNYDMFGAQWSGNGELTEIGMRQHYLLGHRNRIRYQSFISKEYDPKEIYVISTDVNRTIMSAYAQLQGLYSFGFGPSITNDQAKIAVPPVNDTDFEPEQQRLGNAALPNQMQVIPIHIFDLKAKRFNLHDPSICPNVDLYIQNNKKKKIVKDYCTMFNATYGSQLRKLLNIPSSDVNYFFNYDNIYSIADTYISDYTESKDLSNFTKLGIDLAEFNKTSYDFLSIDMMEVGFGDPNFIVGTMSMSPTFMDIINWMNTRIDGDIKGENYDGYLNPKLVMYSAHDTNLGAIQTYIKSVFNRTQLYYTPFASSIFFELSRPDGVSDPSKLNPNNYTVSAIYNDINLFQMPYPEFQKNVIDKSYTQEQIAAFCGFEPDPNTNGDFNFFVVTTIILGSITVGLLIYVAYMCYKQKSTNMSTQGYNNVV